VNSTVKLTSEQKCMAIFHEAAQALKHEEGRGQDVYVVLTTANRGNLDEALKQLETIFRVGYLPDDDSDDTKWKYSVEYDVVSDSGESYTNWDEIILRESAIILRESAIPSGDDAIVELLLNRVRERHPMQYITSIAFYSCEAIEERSNHGT
jgi:hypothetical protein